MVSASVLFECSLLQYLTIKELVFQIWYQNCLSVPVFLVCLFVCLSVFPSQCLFLFLCLFLSLCLSLSFSPSLPVSVYLSLPLSMSVCLSVCLSFCLSFCLSVCLTIPLKLHTIPADVLPNDRDDLFTASSEMVTLRQLKIFCATTLFSNPLCLTIIIFYNILRAVVMVFLVWIRFCQKRNID